MRREAPATSSWPIDTVIVVIHANTVIQADRQKALSMQRHPNIINLSELEAIQSSHGDKFGCQRKRLAANTGAKEVGCSWYEIPPGKQAFPHHSHFGNEEAFFILSGEGKCRLGDKTFEISAGDYIACPAGAETAHSLVNTGTVPLAYIGISTAHSTDVMLYPDSHKIGVAGGADMHKGLKNAPFSIMIKDQPSVDYYIDED